MKGTPGGGFDTFMSASGEVLKKVENIADALDNVFGDPEVQQSLREGFLNMKDISANMNAFTKVMADVAVDNQQQINVMVKQLSEMSARMNETAAERNERAHERNGKQHGKHHRRGQRRACRAEFCRDN